MGELTDPSFGSGRRYRYWRPEPPLPSLSDQERFWSMVVRGDEDKCWPWRTGKRGTFWWRDVTGNRQHQLASRLAYRLGHGVEIPPDRVVMHGCDFRACCNPRCLSVGPQAKNAKDAVDRGLIPYMESERYTATRAGWWRHGANGPGEDNGFARLSDSAVCEIRQLYATGAWTQCRLARRFSVGQSTISRVVRRASWSHVS